MVDKKDQFREERLRAILNFEREGKGAHLPESFWGFDLTVIDRENLTPHTRKGYRRALKALLDAGIDPFDLEALQKYAEGLKRTHKSNLKRALRLLTLEYEQSVKERATPENLPVIQALVMRLEATRDNIKVGNANGEIFITYLAISNSSERDYRALRRRSGRQTGLDHPGAIIRCWLTSGRGYQDNI